MQVINLYKYTRSDGGTTVSTVKPDTEYIVTYRLVAIEGKILTDGNNTTYCIDVNSTDGWSEIDDENSTYEENVAPGELPPVDVSPDEVNLEEYFDVENNLQEVLEKAYAYEIVTGGAE